MRVAITTLGCKVNQYDSAVIRGRLESDRHAVVPFDTGADCYIINTCTVTDRADWEGRQLVRRAKRLNPKAWILITGCYAQVSPQEVSRIPDVDFVVGLNRLEDLARFIRQADFGPTGNRGTVAVGNPREERGVRLTGARKLPDHTRAFLKVEEGCNYSCTYCIIPTARGRSRSVPEDEVLSQVRSLAAQGCKEVVLTGIHLGSYGRDLTPRSDLARLVRKIADGGWMERLRLSSLDPREVTKTLLQFMARSPVLCPHLHVCLQAGDDGTLRRMRRNYTTSYYADLMGRVRDSLPDAALGSDIIVGFPGETEGDFEQSMAFLNRLPLTYLHVFPYSPRRGTVAAALPGQVPLAVRKQRAKRMRELGMRKKRAFYQRFLGCRVRVLVERAVDERRGLYKGYSRNYLPVLVSGNRARVNHEADVLLGELDGGWLRGRMAGTY